jgi:hypothetical protein
VHANAQKDTFEVAYPELLKGLDSIRVINFDNTEIFENKYLGTSNEFIKGLNIVHPSISRPYMCKIEQKWFLTYSGSGLVFEFIDSFRKVKRIDQSNIAGYNYGQFVFVHPSGICIMSMGGYGYWNFNGTLRSFSNDHKSWDCADLTWPKEEIVLKSTNCLLQSDYNDNKGIFLANVCKRCNKSNEFINTNECYLIGPKSSEVAYIGTINDELSDTYYICQSIGGIIAEGNNHFYFIDFSKNEFYILNSDLSKLLYQYTRAKSPIETYYIDKNVLKIFNTQTKQWKTKRLEASDWTKVNALAYQAPMNKNTIMGFSAGISILLISLLAFLKKRKSKNVMVEAAPIIEPIEQIAANPSSNAQSYWYEQLSETERELLRTILNNHNHASLDQINRILGVQDKSSNVQKFHRHKIITDLNNSYSLVYAVKEDLIVRTKSEEDKRIFNYSINEAYLEDLKIGCSPSL